MITLTYRKISCHSAPGLPTISYLTLNSQKCRYMIFTRKHQPTFPTSDLYVNDHHALVKTDHYKYLGLNLSPDLSWSHHIDLICTKTRKLVGMLYRNFYKYSSSPTLLKVYKALIRPHLKYAGVVWDPSLVPRLLVGGEKKSLVSTVRACA